jgi:hypothetical protein
MSTNQEQIERFWTHSGFRELEFKLIEHLVSQSERDQFSDMAVDAVASEYGMSTEDFRRTILGEHGTGHRWHSIRGGETGTRWKELCLGAVQAKLETSRAVVHKAVCIDFQYCQKRRSGQFEEEGVALAMALADSMLNVATGLPTLCANMSETLRHCKINVGRGGNHQ